MSYYTKRKLEQERAGQIEFEFSDPGGQSALRAAGKNNPRNLPCPTCGTPNTITPADRKLGYQCDKCAERAERRLE